MFLDDFRFGGEGGGVGMGGGVGILETEMEDGAVLLKVAKVLGLSW